jgi:tetratricopeptide (TPR) repeat protein
MLFSLLLLIAQQQTTAIAPKAGPVLRDAERARAAAAKAAAPAPAGEPPRFTKCMDLATGDPNAAVEEAVKWGTDKGGMFARQCLAVAYANQARWDSAAAAFEEAAGEAETVKDNQRAATYWTQAGNAWLAAKKPPKARASINAALATGALQGLALGEAYLDRARAAVASGENAGARADIDVAIAKAGDDPLAWLLSATLARRMNDLPRAQKDIAEAVKRAGDDAAVQLEAGNIAAAAGDEAAARTAWNKVVAAAPGSPQATAARAALAQFEAPPAK